MNRRKAECRWSAIGSPDTPGTYEVRGIGPVAVEQEHIDTVAEHDGGNPILKLEIGASGSSKTPLYHIVGYRSKA
jgi:hypothetical protein